jgi:glycosyltransferase involved in cell wall biosynthesis
MCITGKQLDFCLLIPCYNNLEGLIFSLKTVFYYPDRFAVVVVDDGSAVPVAIDKIKSDINLDYPVIILRNEENRGITDALNKGLEWIEENINPKYIARLDCGDSCDTSRFYKQVEYMDRHPDTSLLGSWCLFENRKTSFGYRYKTPVSHEQIKKAMYFRNIFIHPTVIFKASLLEKTGYYPKNYMYAEDYAFFWKLIRLSPSHILGEFLVTCEINSEGISFKNRQKQLAGREKVITEFGSNFFLRLSGRLRIKVLRILPKRLILRLKKLADP